MSLPSIHAYRLPSAGGFAAPRRALPKELLDASGAGLARVKPDLSAADAGQWSSAIATAMAQLGLVASPAPVPAGASGPQVAGSTTGSPLPQGDTWLATRRGAHQVQQYRSIASTSSGLVRALAAGASGATPDASGATGLSVALQHLWTSTGALADAGAAGHAPMPGLQTFLQSLAGQVGESGISGLRGVFVDAVA